MKCIVCLNRVCSCNGWRTSETPYLNGKVLWINGRDGNGIILDNRKREFYFDISANRVTFEKLQRGDEVSFLPTILLPDDILVAKEVRGLER